MALRLTTLGTPSVLLDGEELTSLPGKPVTFGLLVFLALEGEATRDRLVSVFWPESSQDKARHALSQTLYELRQALGEEWVEASGNILKVTDALWVDCAEFLDRAEAGQNDDAVSLYAGSFLDGVYLAQTHAFEEWVERQRARLGRRYRATVDAFIEERMAEGDLDSALKSAWKWVELDPLDDGGQQHLIQLLAVSGSRSEALAQFDRYRALLREELGLEPLEETLELVKAIRAGEMQAPGAAPHAEKVNIEDSARDTSKPSEPETPAPASTWPTPVPVSMKAGSAINEAKDRAELQKIMEAELSPSLDILRPIGQGSMAEVFLAREPHLKRLVAVKVLSPHLYSDLSARKRFEREAQAAARINHPHVCTVHRVGSLSDGTPFLVSPFVKGTSLAQRLKAEGRLGPDEVRRVLQEVASALAAAHQLGIIHRDVRPDNILRADETGRHSLCDFGIAGVLETGEDHEPKITKTGEILGHPAYISPEQMDGQPLTDRADIYSLGVLAHQLLTGHPPPPIENLESDRAKKGTGSRLEPLGEFLGETDRELVDLVSRCLAINPAHRPTAADIERKLGGERRHGAKVDLDKLVEVNLLKLIFRKRLPHFLGAYLAGAWAAVEAAIALNNWRPSGWLIPLVVASLPFGFLAVSIFGWFHGEKGRQEVPEVEKWLLFALGLGWVGAAVWVLLAF